MEPFDRNMVVLVINPNEGSERIGVVTTIRTQII